MQARPGSRLFSALAGALLAAMAAAGAASAADPTPEATPTAGVSAPGSTTAASPAAGSPAAGSPAASIETFTPQGAAKNVRQVLVRFSGSMIAFGDPRPADPFDANCSEPGTGRWLDDKNWSYDFERDLPAGASCRFVLRRNLRDVAGRAVVDRKAYEFSTGGPMVLYSQPAAGDQGIDENQIFMLGLDAPADEKSILKNVSCRVDGVDEKIGVRIVDGQARDELLKKRAGFRQTFGWMYFRQRGEATPTGADDARLAQLPVVLLQCRRTLFPGARVDLVWGGGVSSRSGIAGSAEQSLSFRTRPDFSANFSCERMSAKSQCIPFLPMTLSFSAPIKTDDARRIALRATGDGKIYAPQIDADSGEFVQRLIFKGPFPEQARFAIELPSGLRDDAQRKLSNHATFPLAVATDEMPPLAKFAAPFGIVELHGDATLPVTLRNIEAQVDTRMVTVAPAVVPGKTLRVGAEQDGQIQQWFYRLEEIDRPQWNENGEIEVAAGERSLFAAGEAGSEVFQRFQLPKPNGAQPFEVVGIPLGQSGHPKPGFYVVELASPKLGAALLPHQTPMYVRAAALVTNMAVHFKSGAESSAIWVTALDSARPVGSADVAVRDCSGATLWQGKTAADGVARIPQTLPKKRCDGRGDDYFISARHGDDVSFALSSWGGGIQPWRFNLPYAYYGRSSLIVHTVFDRTLLMANDTLHMKHFRRDHTAGGIVLPPRDAARKTGKAVNAQREAAAEKLVIRHVGSDQSYELPLTWTANGSAENSWKVPVDAKQGTYRVELGGRDTGTFRVEAFRVPTMQAVLQGPKTDAVQTGRVDIDIQLNYLAGGAAALAPVKLRSALENRAVEFRDYEDYIFANGLYRSEEGELFDYDSGGAPAGGVAMSAVRTQNLQLDAEGAARASIDQLPRVDVPRTLRAELEYRDANGETATTATRIALWPARYLVGVRSEQAEAGKLQVVALVLDLVGKPVADAKVDVDLLQRSYVSHRRRLLGGFYAYEHRQQVKPLGTVCTGTTDAAGVLRCEAAAPGGNIVVQARTVDPQGNASSAHQDTWIADADDQWFAASDNDRIDVLPERRQYEPGETATLQVRMPFREATALITVEREGVLDTYVQPLSGKDPVVRVPIKGNYAPNLYVSVFVVRGRVGEPQPTALVDLGRPAYRMGIAELRVGWRAHELKVAVDADKPVYKVRDKASVKIRVRRADGSAPPVGSEVALAAIDEGLLALQPNDSWQLLDAMMQRRPLEVTTATAQLQVIGKRHYGRKAVPNGGGGGRSAARELLDAALFWRGRVALDRNGDASVEVPLNDALTTFRVVAIASGGSGLFGTGATALRSTQDLILIGGLPPLVREGDRQRAGFTVRNTSNKALQVAVTATLKALPAEGASVAQPPALPVQTVDIAPGQAREIGWSMAVPAGAGALQWEIAARDRQARTGDRLRIEQKVTAAQPLRTLQATLAQLDKPFELPVQRPAGADPSRGGIETTLVDRLGAALPGVREYMAAYPYGCFEQRASKAVALRDAAAWQTLMNALPTHLDRNGLVKYFPRMDEGSDVLTAYVLSVADTAGYAIPAASLQKMRDGLLGFVEGKVARASPVPAADLSVRKLAALAALARFEPVRPQLLDSLQIEPQRWPTSAVLDWHEILLRSADLPQRDQALHQVAQVLRTRLTWQGSTATLSSERGDALWWLMVSGDTNINRLILAVLDDPAWQDDRGRLLRGALARQKRGHWDTSVANAWGTLAFEKFSAQYENAAVTGSTQLQLADAATAQPASGAVDWQATPHGGVVSLPWPAQAQTLTVDHRGGGAPWALVRSKAVLPLNLPVASGYRVVKTVSAVERKAPDAWSVGDVYRVHLDVTAQSDFTWVVIDDPVPAGATILGSGLGNDSALLAAARTSSLQPVFEERGFGAYRAYYLFAPKGSWSLEYTVRINNAGEFGLPPTRVEAMYAPEAFGETPNAAWTVVE